MDYKYRKYFLEILEKYNNGDATGEEIEFLEKFYDAFDLNDDLIIEEEEKEIQDIKLSIKRKVDQQIDQIILPRRNERKKVWLWYAAAVVIVFLSVSVYLFIKPAKTPSGIDAAAHILPGGNRAMLTLSNGTKIVLDDAHKGQIAKQSNISITKTGGNQIVYTTGSTTTDNKQLAYQLQNTISTPNGGQYSLVLPDGTKVMLNAASSLTYPAAFHGTERLVQLTGEAYFEVAKNKKMPFRVKSANQTVEVLGTHFNINSYQDEASIKTTLLEGAVKVSSGSASIAIIPGQQAVVNRVGEGEVSKHTVDVDKETAWKDGLFSFQNDDLKSIMRQVARWYDVKIVYADNLPNEKFIGEISRSSNLSDVFKILELNNVHFEVEGKIVTVSAK
jgi:transmembrane sensor